MLDRSRANRDIELAAKILGKYKEDRGVYCTHCILYTLYTVYCIVLSYTLFPIANSITFVSVGRDLAVFCLCRAGSCCVLSLYGRILLCVVCVEKDLVVFCLCREGSCCVLSL